MADAWVSAVDTIENEARRAEQGRVRQDRGGLSKMDGQLDEERNDRSREG